MKKQNKDFFLNSTIEHKEPFCGMCVSIPIGMASSGITAFSANQKGKYKKHKKIIFLSGFIITIISIIVSIYFLKTCSDCG